MGFIRSDINTQARVIAQDARDIVTPATGPVGVSLLLSATDYDQALDSALVVHSGVKPRRLVTHYTCPTSGQWRFTLAGTTPIVSGWLREISSLNAVWLPYDATDQNGSPLDPNDYRTVNDPSDAVVLEVLVTTATAGDVMRLEMTSRHTVDAVTAASTTIPDADRIAFATLAAAFLLRMAGNKAIQNVGTSGLPNDITDRRTQADVFFRASKDLESKYLALVGVGGIGAGSGSGAGAGPVTPGASAWRDFDVQPSSRLGFLWHPSQTR